VHTVWEDDDDVWQILLCSFISIYALTSYRWVSTCNEVIVMWLEFGLYYGNTTTERIICAVERLKIWNLDALGESNGKN
jgi:hypothetical protein